MKAERRVPQGVTVITSAVHLVHFSVTLMLDLSVFPGFYSIEKNYSVAQHIPKVPCCELLDFYYGKNEFVSCSTKTKNSSVQQR